MKQVLFLSAGEAFPEGAFAFMASFKKWDVFHVKGLFFSPMGFDGRISSGFALGKSAIDKELAKEWHAIKAQKERFARNMEELGLPYSIHENDEPWNKELFTKETRFADIVTVSAEMFYSELESGQSNLLFREVLRETEAPILVIPENAGPPTKLVFAYDGSRESVHALKLFTYFFPDFVSLPTEVIYAKEEESDDAPDKHLLGEYARLNYTDIQFSKLHFKPADLFPAWFRDKVGALLITGSFGRSALSYMAKRSFAEKVIAEHRLPLFITHF